MTDLSSLTIAAMRDGLQGKQFSSTDLVNAALQKAEKLSHLNCFIELCPDQARRQAVAADARIAKGDQSPLLGIPVAIKDVISTRGIRTTCGSRMLSSYIPPYDATVVRKLHAVGAVSIGKTNMDEYAMGSSNENSSFGPVKNPWNHAFVPGGSSGGSAAAVAARIVPTALGTDTGGSIRQPASLCSIAGLKPTYGRVSRYGVVAFASSLDQVGAFARSVSDLARITQSIAGYDTADSTSVDQPVPDWLSRIQQSTPTSKPLAGVRIGIPREYFIPGMSSEVEASVRAAIAQLEKLGGTIADIQLPHTEAAVAVYYIIAPAEASSNLARFDGVRYGYRAKDARDLKDLYFRSRSEGFGREVKRRIMIGTYVLSTGYFDAYYLKAQKVRSLIKRDFDEAFAKHCDVIACPASPTTAFKLGEKVSDPLAMYLNDVFTIPVNLAGLPGMSVPCGFDSQGLPIGLQLIGKPWDEESLFLVSSAYESATAWHLKEPQ